MNRIIFPKCQNDVMLQALRKIDTCPKQNYEVMDIEAEGKVDHTRFIGFIPQTTRYTLTLICVECGTVYRLVLDYSVTRESEYYEVIRCEAR